jgi:hypothetical protein
MRKVGRVNWGVEAKTFGAVDVAVMLVAMMRNFLVPWESVLSLRDGRQGGEGTRRDTYFPYTN